MDPIDRLARIDLNLLVSLHVLLDERSVTRAADRLFITQPAASRTLNRLRELFDDPLLARSGSDMVMTPRAELLRAHLPEALQPLTELVAPVTFDPATYEQLFRLAIPEIFAQALSGPLMHEVLASAPGIRFAFENMDTTPEPELSSGELDFAFNKAGDVETGPAIESTVVMEIGGVIIAHGSHPLARKRSPTLSDVLEFPWIDCFLAEGSKGTSPMDQTLTAFGAQRSVVFSTPHVLSALQAVRSTDCLLFLAGHVIESPLISSDFRLLALPPELSGQTAQLLMYQHRRTQGSQPHQWVKEILLRLGREYWSHS